MGTNQGNRRVNIEIEVVSNLRAGALRHVHVPALQIASCLGQGRMLWSKATTQALSGNELCHLLNLTVRSCLNMNYL